jgi:hypothetical protein
LTRPSPDRQPQTPEEALDYALEVLVTLQHQAEEHAHRVVCGSAVLVILPETMQAEIARGLAALARWRFNRGPSTLPPSAD